MPKKALKNSHTSNSKIGMGDFYGTGIKQKMGRARDVMGMSPPTAAKLKKPPKKLA